MTTITKYVNSFSGVSFDSLREVKKDENAWLKNKGIHFFNDVQREVDFHSFYDGAIPDLGFYYDVIVIYFENKEAAKWFNEKFLSCLNKSYQYSSSVLRDFKEEESLYIVDPFNPYEDEYNSYIPFSDYAARVFALHKYAKNWENKKKALDSGAQR